MEGGLLSLKWNNHRSTFFHVLSTVRKKGSYCDVTIACDGKFYQVHKIVLATCSDYFEQIFERTNPVCKTPVIVLKDIRHEDLEALLNYMYLGEVNVLQTDLSGLIKAAECLRIKGLAVPDEAPSEHEAFHENKRNLSRSSDEPDTKRFRSEIPSTQRLSSATSDKNVREREPLRPQISYREPYREPTRVRETLTLPSSPNSSPASQSTEPHLSNSGARESSPEIPIIKEPLSAQEAHSRGTSHSNANSSSEIPDREAMVDENVVKEEPHDEYSEADETKDSIRSVDSDPGLNYTHQPGDHSSGSVTGDSESTGFMRTSQPQTMEDLVAQVIPGTSGLQGNSWEGDRNLLGMPFEGYSGSQVRGNQMVGMPTATGEIGMRSDSRNISSGFTIPNPPSALTCQYCEKSSFYSPRDLERHIRVHTGEKPYKCPHCNYYARLKAHLKSHLLRKHSGSVVVFNVMSKIRRRL